MPASGLVLIGYRGTGKSTVGRIVAERRGCPFADADAELERHLGRSIRNVFASEGEAVFRDHEADQLSRLVRTPGLAGGVLATGGGAILREANRGLLRRFGLVVWLTADPETLTYRLTHSRNPLADRPALTSAGTLAEVADLLAERTPLYQATADLAIVSSGRLVHDVADLVLAAWLDHLEHHLGWRGGR